MGVDEGEHMDRMRAFGGLSGIFKHKHSKYFGGVNYARVCELKGLN